MEGTQKTGKCHTMIYFYIYQNIYIYDIYMHNHCVVVRLLTDFHIKY